MWTRIKRTTVARAPDGLTKIPDRAFNFYPDTSRYDYQYEQLFDAEADRLVVNIWRREKDECASR